MAIGMMVVASNELVREALVLLLSLQGGLEVVGKAADGSAAADLAARLQPNIAAVDLALAPGGGLAVVRQIRAASTATTVVVFSIHREIEYVQQAFEAGAMGYLLSESLGAELAPAVAAVWAGDHFISPKITTPGHLATTPRAAPGQAASFLTPL